MMLKNNKPLVAIRCTVYNHEPYLRECLDGFVMQKTNFPFVAIVHDDASTDGSAAIIREYEEKYPNIIKPIFEKENQYSKGPGVIGQIMNDAIDSTGAKYVAMCEGDDYWIDPLKLQKQVDFLEANDHCGFIGTKCKVKRNNTLNDEIYPLYEVSSKDGIEYYGDVFLSNAIYGPVTRTCTLLYKKSLLDNELMPVYGDYYLQAILASKSHFARVATISCVYRIHSGGISHNHSAEGELAYSQLYVNQKRYLNNRFPNLCYFDDDELTDSIEYKKIQIAVRKLDYKEYLKVKPNIVTTLYKNKTLYSKINSIISFYIVGIIYYLMLNIKYLWLKE